MPVPAFLLPRKEGDSLLKEKREYDEKISSLLSSRHVSRVAFVCDDGHGPGPKKKRGGFPLTQVRTLAVPSHNNDGNGEWDGVSNTQHIIIIIRVKRESMMDGLINRVKGEGDAVVVRSGC
ncbi:hypothetical protein VNO78_28434 [Psophocarpus tetragonolobus]|uniref:Uncharacterized protein n=1 Tax=Psophocarpus tetragonolobus TaxID=3891 RepID=A0AAN9S4G7_PSOTE